jgi:mono/diheme cytochrome c family protein
LFLKRANSMNVHFRTMAAFTAAGMVILPPMLATAGQGRQAPAPTVVGDAGRQLYLAHCAACHGESGRGDGRAAADFKTRPADLTDPDFADESDRSLMRKMVHTPRPMPNFEQLLSEEQRRQVAGYVRQGLSASPSSSEKSRIASGRD